MMNFIIPIAKKTPPKMYDMNSVMPPGLKSNNNKMIESTLDKIEELENLREKEGYQFEIFVDGGPRKLLQKCTI